MGCLIHDTCFPPPGTHIVYFDVHVTMWLMEIKQIWLCCQPKNKCCEERLISRSALVLHPIDNVLAIMAAKAGILERGSTVG